MDAVVQIRGGRGFYDELIYDENSIDMAARVLLVGGDPWMVINLEDQTDFLIMDAIVDRAFEFQQTRDKNLSQMIANKLGQVMR